MWGRFHWPAHLGVVFLEFFFCEFIQRFFNVFFVDLNLLIDFDLLDFDILNQLIEDFSNFFLFFLFFTFFRNVLFFFLFLFFLFFLPLLPLILLRAAHPDQ